MHQKGDARYLQYLHLAYADIDVFKGVDIKYDVCVIATGSRASLPSCISNTDMDDIRGIFCYRNLEDFDRMIQYSNVQSVKRAAIIGGGLLGLEAAKALCDFGIPQVTVVERNQWVSSNII